jgi:hypothetical protein
VRLDAALRIDLEADLDAAEFDRIEADLEMIDPGEALQADLDRNRSEGNLGDDANGRVRCRSFRGGDTRRCPGRNRRGGKPSLIGLGRRLRFCAGGAA